MLLSQISSRANSVMQFLTVLLLFVFVLVITWFTTRWIGKIQKGQMGGGANLEVIETQRISNNKFLQIVRAGNKYFVIAIGKDEVHVVSEIAEEDIVFRTEEQPNATFAAVLDKVKNLNKKKED